MFHPATTTFRWSACWLLIAFGLWIHGTAPALAQTEPHTVTLGAFEETTTTAPLRTIPLSIGWHEWEAVFLADELQLTHPAELRTLTFYLQGGPLPEDVLSDVTFYAKITTQTTLEDGAIGDGPYEEIATAAAGEVTMETTPQGEAVQVTLATPFALAPGEHLALWAEHRSVPDAVLDPVFFMTETPDARARRTVDIPGIPPQIRATTERPTVTLDFDLYTPVAATLEGPEQLTAGVPAAFTLTLRDAEGRPSVATAATTVALTAEAPGGTAAFLPSADPADTPIEALTVPDGVDDVPVYYLATATTSTPYALTAARASGDAVGTAETLVTVGPALAVDLSLALTGPALIRPDGSTAVDAVVRDAFGNPVADVPVTFTSNAPNRATIAPQAITDSEGRATAEVSGGGEQTGTVVLTAAINASDAEVGTTASAAVSLEVRTTLLSFTTPPGATTEAGQAMRPAPAVRQVDPDANPVADASLVASIMPSAGLVGTTEARTDAEGIAVFDDLRPTRAGTYTLRVATPDGEQAVSSEPFTVTPAAPERLTVAATPATAPADGETAITFAATLADAYGNGIPEMDVRLDGMAGSAAVGVTGLDRGATARTDSDGVASFLARSTTAGGVTALFRVPDAEGTVALTAAEATFSPPPPGAFDLQHPADAATVYGQQIPFTWTAAQGDAPVRYALHVLRDDGEQLQRSGLQDTTHTLPLDHDFFATRTSYTWWVEAYASGPEALEPTVSRQTFAFAIDTEAPPGFALEQNFPNPFAEATTIRYHVPVPARVTLRVYDLQGRLVHELADRGGVAPGSYTLDLPADTLPSGAYIYRLSAEGAEGTRFTQARSMMHVR
ncbi:MAG: T9SS type A sorting domain-containing protein [Bacteroidetes bacterium]|nr:T9SS type A sorting domain-containing protein [Bacteroidota bacterium]